MPELQPAQQGEGADVTPPHKERVLVVDDEPDMAESCAFLLGRQGYETAVATSGEAALTLLEERQFALVVSDVRMPRMSGMQLLSAIKARDLLKKAALDTIANVTGHVPARPIRLSPLLSRYPKSGPE